jgi:cob(I)alamin adenosyltransferase
MGRLAMKRIKGFIQVYTGNGKGKTTAALGLALRAAGAGLKVYIGQFMKKGHYSEINALKKFKKDIIVKQFGQKSLITKHPTVKDIVLARRGLMKCKDTIASGTCDVVILDEINIAVHCKLINVDDIVRMLKNKPAHVEVILTGRNAPERLLGMADLVTEMREVKHYYKSGVMARTGIEK